MGISITDIKNIMVISIITASLIVTTIQHRFAFDQRHTSLCHSIVITGGKAARMLGRKNLLILIFLGLGFASIIEAMSTQGRASAALERKQEGNGTHTLHDYKLKNINEFHPYWQWVWD